MEEDPGVEAVIVTVVVPLAVKPTTGKELLQLLIALARFPPAVPALLLSTNVPVVELLQPFEPLLTGDRISVFDPLLSVSVPLSVV